MSLRRKSCDGCFRARRKCDLTYPTCRDCERRGKHCEYAYPPQLEVNPVDQLQDGDPQKTASLETTAPSSRRSFRVAKQWREQPAVKYTRPERLQLSLGTPKFPEPQGHLQPPVGYDAALPRRPGRFAWVYDQIRDTPYMFAMQAESHFIHRSLIEQYFPRTLRAAFGFCAATTTMTDMNKDFLFKAIDAEVTDLLAVRQDTTLLDGLATLQAAVLYQIIRLFRGGWQQRYVAEQQEYLVRSYALTLLRRSSSSSFSSSPSSSRNFDTWLLEESIRRTVMFAFKIYTMYWSLRRQVCFEIEGLNLLPVSTSPELWEKEGRELFGGHEDPDAVMTHEEFTRMMGAKKSLDGEAPFQKLLVLGCKEKLDGAVLESLG
ncbi:fungal zn(2)-Cys(6) binuclear cluster domain-containing protein [Sarocladium implicatum]|nr:fungal zn(2)-Cys(6) binuclear cluster domain-containing protein [Sarocladium implicatum]